MAEEKEKVLWTKQEVDKVEEEAFMRGYEYAIFILQQSMVKKKEG